MMVLSSKHLNTNSNIKYIVYSKMHILFPTMALALLWAFPPIIHKHILNTMSFQILMIVSGIVYFLCIVLFAAFHYQSVSRDFRNIKWQHLVWVSLISIICSFLTNILYYKTLSQHKSSLVTALVAISPIFTAIMAYTILNEKLDLFSVIGILLVTSGVVLMSVSCST